MRARKKFGGTGELLLDRNFLAFVDFGPVSSPPLHSFSLRCCFHLASLIASSFPFPLSILTLYQRLFLLSNDLDRSPSIFVNIGDFMIDDVGGPLNYQEKTSSIAIF